MTWIFELVNRVPSISDAEISEMRHIEPVLAEDGMFRRIVGVEKLHPRDVSFLWNAKPHGDLFTFEQLNITTIITQHHSSVFFKPSLAEVYAWIRFYLREQWNQVKFFCLESPERIASSTDFYCKCQIMGGDMLVIGDPVTFASGAIGHQLVKKHPAGPKSP